MTIHIFGEAMLEYHSRGSLGGLRYGGDTLNTAIHLARLGRDVRYVTAVGTDRISDALVRSWEAEGIDTRFVLRHPGRNPGIYGIHVDESGERSFLYWREHSAAREMFELAGMKDAIAAAQESSLLYFSLISLAILPDQARDTLLQLARKVRASGGLVAYDSNFRASLWPSNAHARAVSQQAVAAANIGLPTNTDEAEIAGSAIGEPEIARQWYALGCEEVVVKAGEKGCILSVADRPIMTKPVEPVAMLDASGAGDAFNGGYLSARAEGRDCEKSLAAGQMLASWVIQRSGAVPPIDEQAPYAAIIDG